MSAPAKSWCDPAGESPAQVKGSVLLGSECCVATGDSGCEAYTAIAWGVGLSHERSDIAGAESFYSLEGNMCSTAMRGMRAKLKEIKQEARRRMHQPIPNQGKWLERVVRGYFNSRGA